MTESQEPNFRLVPRQIPLFAITMTVMAGLCLTALAAIVTLVLTMDHRQHGEIVLSRAIVNAFPFNRPGAEPDATGGQVSAVSEARPAPKILAEHTPMIEAEVLNLVNQERTAAGAGPLYLEDSPLAQVHAKDMLSHGYRSYWDRNGLTPIIRYTIDGGVGRLKTNIIGPIDIAGDDPDGNEPAEVVPWRQLAHAVHARKMASPLEAANLLDPWHRRLSIGVACNLTHCLLVEEYSAEHVEFSQRPSLGFGRFSVAGRFTNGMNLDAVAIWYQPVPQQLSLGHLDATYFPNHGQPACFLRAPLKERYYPEEAVDYQWVAGVDPHHLPVDMPRGESLATPVAVAHTATVPWITAEHWEASDGTFAIEADLSVVLDERGPGIYTLQLWGKDGRDIAPVTNFAMYVP